MAPELHGSPAAGDVTAGTARPSRTGNGIAGTLLAIGVAASWLAVLFGPDGMGAGPAVFIPLWTVMMAAMMLPSAAPLVLLHAKGVSPSQTVSLAGGYLLVWAAAGIPAYLMDAFVPMTLAPAALAVAGAFQLTPLKESCLRRCRTPADFLVQRWGHGALRLGLEHGVWCLGCCWALMAVLVLVGSMGLVWVVGVAAIVAVEKLAPRGVAWSRVTGLGLVVAAIVEGAP